MQQEFFLNSCRPNLWSTEQCTTPGQRSSFSTKPVLADYDEPRWSFGSGKFHRPRPTRSLIVAAFGYRFDDEGEKTEAIVAHLIIFSLFCFVYSCPIFSFKFKYGVIIYDSSLATPLLLTRFNLRRSAYHFVISGGEDGWLVSRSVGRCHPERILGLKIVIYFLFLWKF